MFINLTINNDIISPIYSSGTMIVPITSGSCISTIISQGGNYNQKYQLPFILIPNSVKINKDNNNRAKCQQKFKTLRPHWKHNFRTSHSCAKELQTKQGRKLGNFFVWLKKQNFFVKVVYLYFKCNSYQYLVCISYGCHSALQITQPGVSRVNK